METDGLKHDCTGFLKDPQYSFHVWDILLEYKDAFGNAENLEINLTEILPQHIDIKEKPIIISEDGKSIVINSTHFQYRDNKGKITGKPSPFEVFQTVRFLLNKAVVEYKTKFSKKNNNAC